MNKLFLFAIGALALTTTTMAFDAAPGAAAVAAALPCESAPSSPTPAPSPSIPAPAAPQNLRILSGGSGGADDVPDETQISGPYVDEADVVPLSIAQSNPHAYYEMLASRPDCLRAHSLRDPRQLDHPKNGGFAHSNTRTLMVTYDPANDPDPRRQDAAKVVVGLGSNSLTNQVRVPIPTHAPESLFVTWDAWFGAEFAFNVADIRDYKTFQFGSPYHDIHMEVRNRFNLAPSTAGLIDGRLYPEAGNYSRGPNVTFPDTLSPRVGTFHIKPETWTRYWAYFKAPAPGDIWYEYSLWAADATTGPVLIYDRLQVRPSPDSTKASWESFWLEFNTSDDVIQPGRPPLVAYVRNVVALKGVSNVTSLLQRP